MPPAGNGHRGGAEQDKADAENDRRRERFLWSGVLANDSQKQSESSNDEAESKNGQAGANPGEQRSLGGEIDSRIGAVVQR